MERISSLMAVLRFSEGGDDWMMELGYVQGE